MPGLSKHPAHIFETHTGCKLAHCPICDGGLGVCTVCGGFEGSLTTECLGRRMTEAEQDDVYACVVDFIDGVWR